MKYFWRNSKIFWRNCKIFFKELVKNKNIVNKIFIKFLTFFKKYFSFFKKFLLFFKKLKNFCRNGIFIFNLLIKERNILDHPHSNIWAGFIKNINFLLIILFIKKFFEIFNEIFWNISWKFCIFSGNFYKYSYKFKKHPVKFLKHQQSFDNIQKSSEKRPQKFWKYLEKLLKRVIFKCKLLYIGYN